MSSFDSAFDFLMSNEDSERECAVVPDAPEGCFAISGINSHYWPEDFARISGLAQAERGPAVKQFYLANFWNTWLGQIADNDLCARVFDSRVNQGAGISTRLLQQSVNELGGVRIAEDGLWGPATLEAVNNQNPHTLLNMFRANRAAYYKGQGNDALVPRAWK